MITRVIRPAAESDTAMADQRASDKPQRLTLADIAAKAGVSRQVVSAVLGISRGNIRYSPETHERVMRIVRETNFRPNRTAKNLVKKRHGALGILVTNFGNVHEQVLRAMLYEAHRWGQILVLDVVSPDDTQPPLFFREDLVDGIVVFEDIGPGTVKRIAELGIPCVRINTNVRNLPGCITYAEMGAMHLAVEHLVEHGHSRIGVLAAPSKHYSMRLRVRGVEKACTKLGLEKPVSHTFVSPRHMGTGNDEAFDELVAFLAQHRAIDGMVLTVDGMAPLFYRACAKLGRRIPDDIAVLGVNNSPVALGVFPALTSLYVEPREVGKKAIQVLNESIEGVNPPPPAMKLTYRMAVRESTA
ncbi:MAG: LacI family DNA-binding transcriptional regulator [Chitinivibrionales bacterium]|nr:LacI family DNA-binding transcriptional regulator [Chitinivibrionales bacterium]